MIDVGRDFERMRDYIVGRMSDDERVAFEDRLGRDPELVRELEQSLRLRDGLLQLKAQGYFTSAPRRPDAAPAGRAFKPGGWLPALAAAAVAAVALFLWMQPRMIVSGVLRASASAPVAAHFTFQAMRSAEPTDLPLPPKGAIEVLVKPAAHAEISRFRVTLLFHRREDEQAVRTPAGALAGLAVDADGYIRFYADSSRLAPGRYELRVDPDNGTGAAPEYFAFRLQGSGAPSR
jgi:hypothetical protein